MMVGFRADASVAIGHGHVTRCLTLAGALRDAGARVWFVSRELEGNLFQRIRGEGHTVLSMPPGTEADADAELTRAALNDAGVRLDWLVVDHYALGAAWESAVRACAQRILVIDDLADRVHDCDVLLDQNIVANAETRYRNLVPAACATLLGPDYALLQPVYRELHERATPRSAPVRRILISWGGTDHDNLTRRSVEAVLALGRNDIETDVVITGTHRSAPEIEQLAANHASVHLHRDLPTLAHLMMEADVAIGAVGTTSWERLCLGLPTLAVTIADNQRDIARELDRRGLIAYLGHRDEVTDEQLLNGLQRIISADISAWSQRCLETIDGRGNLRVMTAMLSASAELVARRASAQDEALILEWANDELTRLNAFHPERISAADHHVWFQKRLADPGCHFFVLEMPDGQPVAQVRFDRIDDGWRISYAVAPSARGRGLGRTALTTALRVMADNVDDDIVMGEVKTFNRASSRVFESLGFTSEARDGFFEYRSRLSRFAANSQDEPVVNTCR